MARGAADPAASGAGPFVRGRGDFRKRRAGAQELGGTATAGSSRASHVGSRGASLRVSRDPGRAPLSTWQPPAESFLRSLEPRPAVFRTFSKPRPAHARRVSSDPVFWMRSLPGRRGGGRVFLRREAAVEAFSVGTPLN